MSKTRHRSRGRPDGPVVVRTFPVTFLHDTTWSRREDGWHTFIYALEGHLELNSGATRRLVPRDRAVWIPAGEQVTAVVRAPISMRSLFFAPAVVRPRPQLRAVLVSPLLRELIVEVTRLGALDRREPRHRRLLAVLLDEVREAAEATIEVPLPIDPRARRFADAVTRAPGDARPVADLARAVGASARTIERCFRAETGMTTGQWRRRVRLFHAMTLLEQGESATTAALESGYRSPSAFTQAYLRQFDRTPSGRRRTASSRGHVPGR